MLILCILRHDQTLDPDVPSGKRPRKKSQSNGVQWSNFRLWMAVTNLTKISDNKQPVKRISADVVARSAAIKRNSLASRSPFAPPSFPPDKIKQINDILDNLGVHKAFQKVTESDGFFGRGHLYLDNGVTNDDDELRMDLGDGRNPLSKQKVGSDKSGKSQRLIRVLPVEATWCYPTGYDFSRSPQPGLVSAHNLVRSFSLGIAGQVLRFRTRARTRVMPPIHRAPRGQ